MYRESPTAVRPAPPEAAPGILKQGVYGLFLVSYFTLLPIFLIVIIHWAVYTVMMNTFYDEPWMGPTLLLLSTFLAGALMRQKMEDDYGGMTLLVLGILALVGFAWLTHYSILHTTAIYATFLPKPLPYSLLNYIWMLPADGLLGMLAYKAFTLKHYG